MEKKELNNSDLIALIQAAVENGGVFRFFPRGVSMLPTVRPGMDEIELSRVDRIEQYDLLLYVRENGAPILHRLLRITKKGLTFAGDNQGYAEKAVPPDAVLAKATAIIRNSGTANEERRSLSDPGELQAARRQGRRYPLRRLHRLLSLLKQRLLAPFRK